MVRAILVVVVLICSRSRTMSSAGRQQRPSAAPVYFRNRSCNGLVWASTSASAMQTCWYEVEIAPEGFQALAMISCTFGRWT